MIMVGTEYNENSQSVLLSNEGWSKYIIITDQMFLN